MIDATFSLPLAITSYTLTSALGCGNTDTLNALLTRRSGLSACDFYDVDLPTWIGRVKDIEQVSMPQKLAPFACRNNQLALLALLQDDFLPAIARAKQHYGAHRIAVIVGTSTSGILQTELAFRRRSHDGNLPEDFHYTQTHEIASAAEFTRQMLQLNGPGLAISTACSSSAKAFASAQRMIAAGLCDAAVVGGVDSLCHTTLYGFSSLELLSTQPCRPADAYRDGISIGEAAGFVLLEKQQMVDKGHVAFLGYGESNDAHHMSTPHPEGLGAKLAMERALASARLDITQVDYINLHGTASKTNDRAEDLALTQLCAQAIPCSSTKGWTGHTLGAAGVTEAIISALCIEHDLIPGSLNTVTIDPAFNSQIMLENQQSPVRCVLSNSFGFGGNNCTLTFARMEQQ